MMSYKLKCLKTRFKLIRPMRSQTSLKHMNFFLHYTAWDGWNGLKAILVDILFTNVFKVKTFVIIYLMICATIVSILCWGQPGNHYVRHSDQLTSLCLLFPSLVESNEVLNACKVIMECLNSRSILCSPVCRHYLSVAHILEHGWK